MHGVRGRNRALEYCQTAPCFDCHLFSRMNRSSIGQLDTTFGAIGLGRRNSVARDMGMFRPSDWVRDGRLRLLRYHRTSVLDGLRIVGHCPHHRRGLPRLLLSNAAFRFTGGERAGSHHYTLRLPYHFDRHDEPCEAIAASRASRS